MDALEKGLLLWPVCVGLRLVLPCQGVWLQELEGKVLGRKHSIGYCREWLTQVSFSAAVPCLRSRIWVLCGLLPQWSTWECSGCLIREWWVLSRQPPLDSFMEWKLECIRKNQKQWLNGNYPQLGSWEKLCKPQKGKQWWDDTGAAKSRCAVVRMEK